MRALTIALCLLATPALADVARTDMTASEALNADAMLEKGDVDGYAVWKRILRAVGELLSEERPKGVAAQ